MVWYDSWDDSGMEDFVVKSLRELWFLKILWDFGDGNGLLFVLHDNVL